MSLPDAIAQALEEHIGYRNGYEYPELPDEEDEILSSQHTLPFDEETNNPASADICPVCGNGTLLYTEGCKKCLSCGYSEC